MLVNDNAESRRVVEQCFRLGRVTVNPIVEWSDADVWDFIREERLPVCSLYHEGFDRLGCIGCPMARPPKRLAEFARYPAFARLYRRAIGKWIARMVEKKGERWKTDNTLGLGTVDEWWHWWLQDRPLNQEVLPGFEEEWDDE